MNSVVLFPLLLVLQSGSIADSVQRAEEDKIQSGEAGYRVGCAAARSMGVNNVCGEHYEVAKQNAQDQERRRQEYLQRQKDAEISGAARNQPMHKDKPK